MNTRLYNFDPPQTPLLYSKTGVYRGIHYIKNYSSNIKNFRVFLSENFQFLEVKLSIYLNRCVFLMRLDEAVILSTNLTSGLIYKNRKKMYTYEIKMSETLSQLQI